MTLPHPQERFGFGLDQTAYLFDLDGTLLEIAALPDDVVAPPRLQEALAALLAQTDGAVGIVSGRRVGFLEAILPGLGAPLAGVHGLELKLGRGTAMLAEPDGGPGLAALRGALGPWLKRHPGLTVEDKGLSIAVHFRARPELEPEVEAFAQTCVARPDSGLVAQHGKMVVEIRAAGPRKGDAVAAIMALPAFADRRPLYFGDDLTDEHAFAAAAALGGGGVFVGEPLLRPTLAAAGLADPSAVLAYIESLVRPQAVAGVEQERPTWR